MFKPIFSFICRSLSLILVGLFFLFHAGAFAAGTYKYAETWDLPSLGAENSKVVVLEFFSPTCHHCRDFQTNILPDFKKNFIDTNKITYVAVPFPFDEVGEQVVAALLAHPDMYYAAMDTLYTNFSQWVEASDPLEAVSQLLMVAGIDVKEALKDEMLRQEVQDIKKHALDVDMVQGTPSFFINGVLFKGQTEELSDAIQKELDKE